LTIYEQLRSIGVSVETADALEPILEGLPDKKREAFFLWACGYSWADVCKMCKMSKRDFSFMLKYVKHGTKIAQKHTTLWEG
jgi:DNA-directed RNA polymerase specialized sigma24 family protein